MENSTSFTYFYPLILEPTGKWKLRLEGLRWTRMRTMFQFRVKPSPQSSLLKSCLASMEDGWFNYYEDEVWFQAYFPSNFGKSLSFSLSTKFKACCGFIILSKYFWRFWRFSCIASKIVLKNCLWGHLLPLTFIFFRCAIDCVRITDQFRFQSPYFLDQPSGTDDSVRYSGRSAG